VVPVSGDDLRVTWPQHPDPEVEQMFRDANQAGYVIFRIENVYTLVSPDNKTMNFLGRVVASSGIWRLMVRDLQGWLAQTMKDESEGQGGDGLQNLD